MPSATASTNSPRWRLNVTGGGSEPALRELNGVRLKNPDVKINLEIDGEELFIVSAIHQGLSGMPIATQEDVLSLLSGGFDSGVASFQFIKARLPGALLLLRNLGGAAHEIGVKQVAYHLWNRFGSSHRVRFTAVDFRARGGRDLRRRSTTARWGWCSNG